MRPFLTTMFTGALVLGVWTAQAADVPADWVEVKAGPMFTVKAPPGTSFERTRVGDAFSGTFHGAGFDLIVEFGYHRDEPKNPASATNTKVDKFVFDEKPGTITTANVSDPAHPYFVGLHVPSVETDVFGPLSLIVTGEVSKAEDQATVQRIFETVTFGYKN